MTPRGTRLMWLLVITLLLTHGVMVWVTRSPGVTPAANDDAQYLLLARSLRHGHYQDIHLPGAPVHAQYPPVYPALLALPTAILGEKADVAIAVTLLCSLLGLLLVFDLARRLSSPTVALLVLAALVFNTHLIQLGGRIATERPYGVLAVLALWLLVVLAPGRRTLALAGLAAILAALTRSVGVSLVAAVLVFWLLQRRWKAAAIFAVAAAVTVGGWLYWISVAPNQFTERSYSAVTTSTARHFPGPLGMLEVRSVKFVKVYVVRSSGAGLMVPTIEGSQIDNGIWVLLIVGLGIVGLWAMRRRAPIIPLYVLAYLGLLLVYPYKLTRFFMPIASLTLLCMMLGAWAVGRRWRSWAAVALPAAIAGLILVNEVPKALASVRAMESCDRNRPLATGCWGPDRRAFIEAAELAKQELPSDARVVTIKEATFHWYTGLPVVHPDFAALKGGDQVMAWLKGEDIHYVLVSAFRGGAEILRSLAPACERVELLGRFEPRTALLRIHPAGDPVPDARASCPVLQEWQGRLQEEEGSDDELE